MNTIKNIVASCEGQTLTINLPRKEALDLMVKIRSLYGPSGTLVNVYHKETTYLMFGRSMPFLYELLNNEGLDATVTNGHIDVNGWREQL